MTGTAMLIFACGFFIYAVSPSYANETSEVNKPQMESNDDYFSVASGGYLYTWSSRTNMGNWCFGSDDNGAVRYPTYYKPTKRKLP